MTTAARNLALSAVSALAVIACGLVVLFAFALLTTVIPFGSAYVWANVGVVVSLLVVVVTLVVAIEVAARRWGKRVARLATAATVAVVLVIGISLTQHPTPLVEPYTEFFLPRTPHDVLVVVDPNDPTIRGLAQAAKANPQSFEPLNVGSWGTDVAFGVAVLRPPGSTTPWSLVQRPTTDYRKVIAALALVKPSSGGRATTSLGPALRELAASGQGLPWRRGRPHTILLATGELPTDADLHLDQRAWQRTLDALARSTAPGLDRSAFSILWDPETKPTKQTEELWRTWTRHALGNAAVPQFPKFLDSAAYASLRRYFTRDFELATTYRPHLKFDSEEKFRPLDVTAFLAKAQPKLCEPKQRRKDACPPARVEKLVKTLHGEAYDAGNDSYVLERMQLANKKSYLELGGDERTGRDLAEDDRGSAERQGSFGKIYYRITRHAGRAYVEYWWFLRFNESPVYANFMCVAGLSIANASCFDHQGDWEGITVSVADREGAGTRGARITYTGHNWPGYSYRWGELSARGSVDGTHPVVYVAKGSHASYPTACSSDCTQLDFRINVGPFKVKLPDGDHDGKAGWPPNNAPAEVFCGCLEPLPLDFSGRPAHWLAYQGQWGSAACTYILKACTRITGPHSPAYQGRYGAPFKLVWGSRQSLG